MSIYDNQIINSDLDAFKHSGVIQSASFTVSGVIGVGQRLTFTSTPLIVTSPDFAQILFDNSSLHSGRFKIATAERFLTSVPEVTLGSSLGCGLNLLVTSSQLQVTGTLFNPYAVPVTLQSTVINFKYIPYEATF